jgi:hydrogenase maturation protease
VQRVAVLALGNVLMGDDGLGPAVAAQLRACYRFPDDVPLLDLGTPGLALCTHLEPWQRVILVDALYGPRAAGRVVVLRGAAAVVGLSSARAGAHEPGLDYALLAAGLLGNACPDLVLIGAVVRSAGPGASLSPTLARAAGRVAALVVRQLDRWGVNVVQHDDPAASRIWWGPQRAERSPCTR